MQYSFLSCIPEKVANVSHFMFRCTGLQFLSWHSALHGVPCCPTGTPDWTAHVLCWAFPAGVIVSFLNNLLLLQCPSPHCNPNTVLLSYTWHISWIGHSVMNYHVRLDYTGRSVMGYLAFCVGQQLSSMTVLCCLPKTEDSE